MRAGSVRVVVACVSSVALAACSGTGRDLPDRVARVSGRAPPISGPALAGRLPPLRGRILVVNFWNPYCPPCRVEEPALERAAERLAGTAVVVGVHYAGGQWPPSVAAVRSFRRAAGVTYPTVADGGGGLSRGFGIQGIPTTVIVGPDGRRRFVVLGRVAPGEVEDLVARVRRT
jgi:thiol-disulfide isomerase/thioredoxin